MILERTLSLGDQKIGDKHPPFVIAEVGSNHDGSFERAVSLIDCAANAGAQAVKFQLFEASELVDVKHPAHVVLRQCELQPGWLVDLETEATRRGLHFMLSVFSLRGFAVADETGASAHKVASSELRNLRLLNALATNSKPVILSTGMSGWVDIEVAVELLTSRGKRDIALMQCTSLYPCPTSELHISAMARLASRYGGVVGLSDHSESMLAGAVAVGAGARILEKHITWNRQAPGPDHSYALEPQDFASYVANAMEAFTMLGEPSKTLVGTEIDGRRRSSLYYKTSFTEGHSLSENDWEERGPLSGIDARYARDVVGTQLIRNVAGGDPVLWSDVI